MRSGTTGSVTSRGARPARRPRSPSLEAHLRDLGASTHGLEGTRGLGGDLGGGRAGALQARRERHAETCRVRGGDQLFRIGAALPLESRGERVVALERPGPGGVVAVAVLKLAVPCGARGAGWHPGVSVLGWAAM